MGALSKAAILAAAAAQPEVVAVPEWGGDVTVRLLTGTERDAVFSGLKKGADGSTDMRDYRARLVAAAVVLDGGETLTLDDVAGQDDTHPTAVLRLFSAAQRINRLRPEDMEAAAGN